MEEQVLVFNESPTKFIEKGKTYTTDLKQINDWQNIINETKYYMPRQLAENDESRKQIIPYCILQNKQKQILCYQRTKKGGESRLHDLYSIGIGGHVNPEDNFNIFNCAVREIHEELHFNGEVSKNWFSKLGLIYDSSNAVGRVHFGIVLVCQFPFDNMTTKTAPELTNAEWLMLEEIENKNLENWSKIAVEMLKLPRE